MTIKIRLKEVREKRGLSINQLAKLTLISRSYLYDLERIGGNFSLPTLDKLCKALRCQPGDLQRYEPDTKTLEGKQDV